MKELQFTFVSCMMAAMNASTLKAVSFLVFALLVVGAGYFYQNTMLPVRTTSTVATTTAEDAVFSMLASEGFEAGGQSSTNIIPIAGNKSGQMPKAPDYTRPLTFTAKMSATEKSALQKSYATVQTEIKKDALSFNDWVYLGNINLMAGNYKLAQEYWDYVSLVWPTNVSSFNNLGDLYMSYLKDYPKAEANFLQAIKNKPDDTNPYRNLFTLYSETSYKPSNTAAEDILKKAIAANPRAVDMQYMLAVYYKKLGRTQDAQAMFQAAITNATNQGQTALAAQIKLEAAKK